MKLKYKGVNGSQCRTLKFVISYLMLTILFSCGKNADNIVNPSNNDIYTMKKSNYAPMIQNEVMVSPKGYLNFETTEDFINYKNFLDTHTYPEIKSYIQQIGFQSLAGENFTPENPEHLNQEEQTKFLFNQDFILQVGTTIIKPISNYQFILTIDQNKLTDATFTQFKNGNFNINVMNKLSGLNFPAEHYSLFDFAGYSKYGNEDIDPNQKPPVETMSWFWHHDHKEEIIGGEARILRVTDDYYLFGIRIIHSVTFPQADE